MSRLRNTSVALFVGTSVLGLSEFSSAQYLEGAERASFIASAMKACVKTYGTGQTTSIPKPLFEQYCVCAINGAVDRIPAADLLKDSGTDDLSKENQKIFDEEVTRCYAAVKELTKSSRSQLNSETPSEAQVPSSKADTLNLK